MREADVRRSLAAGEEWMLARLGNEPVHFRVYSTGRIELTYLGRSLRLSRTATCCSGWPYTAAAMRRRGLLAAAAVGASAPRARPPATGGWWC